MWFGIFGEVAGILPVALLGPCGFSFPWLNQLHLCEVACKARDAGHTAEPCSAKDAKAPRTPGIRTNEPRSPGFMTGSARRRHLQTLIISHNQHYITTCSLKNTHPLSSSPRADTNGPTPLLLQEPELPETPEPERYFLQLKRKKRKIQ